jgi:hypothetical protein
VVAEGVEEIEGAEGDNVWVHSLRQD